MYPLLSVKKPGGPLNNGRDIPYPSPVAYPDVDIVERICCASRVLTITVLRVLLAAAVLVPNPETVISLASSAASCEGVRERIIASAGFLRSKLIVKKILSACAARRSYPIQTLPTVWNVTVRITRR